MGYNVLARGEERISLADFEEMLLDKPESETRDRVIKRIAYQRLESLRACVLVERDRMLVDVYARAGFRAADRRCA